MKAILIDPEAETVTEVDFDGDYRSIYRLIGCDTFTVVRLSPDEAIFVDDEGLLKDPHDFFIFEGYPQPLAGKGLILGNDPEGETVATKLSARDVGLMVRFAKLKMLGWETSEGEEETAFGKMHVIRNKPIFGVPDQETREAIEAQTKKVVH